LVPALEASCSSAWPARDQRREARRQAHAAKAHLIRWRFGRGGVVTVRSYAYIRPSLGNAIATGGSEPQGSCFLWSTSLVSALQSTR
jgi:hypothetical protein